MEATITNPERLSDAVRRYHTRWCACRGQLTCQGKQKAEAA